MDTSPDQASAEKDPAADLDPPIDFESACEVLKLVAAAEPQDYTYLARGEHAWLSRLSVGLDNSLGTELQLALDRTDMGTTCRILIPGRDSSTLLCAATISRRALTERVDWFMAAQLCRGLDAKHPLLAHRHDNEILVPGSHPGCVHFPGTEARRGCQLACEKVASSWRKSYGAFNLCSDCFWYLDCLIRRPRLAQKNGGAQAHEKTNTKYVKADAWKDEALSGKRKQKLLRRKLLRRDHCVEKLLKLKIDQALTDKLKKAKKIVEAKGSETGKKLEELLAGDKTGLLKARFDASLEALERQGKGGHAKNGMRYDHVSLQVWMEMFVASPKALSVLRDSQLCGVPCDKTLAAYLRSCAATNGFTREAYERMEDNKEQFDKFNEW